MQIIRAQNAGFCFGVKRAMDIAYANAGSDTFTFGNIINNMQVVDALRKQGVRVLSEGERPPPSAKVIIRSHGVGRQTYETLEALGANVIDATCPFVAKIHNIAREYYNNGYRIMIFGDAKHPEVEGIRGWCDNNADVFDCAEQLQDYVFFDKMCVVAQTTADSGQWARFKERLSRECPQAVIHDTICDATQTRQHEARQIAEQADIMIVIGGRDSSNTKKLVQICRQHCEQTFHIETAEELKNILLENRGSGFCKRRLPEGESHSGKIGITAGASTPDWIIEEVVELMTEEKMVFDEEESFEKQLEKSMTTLSTGDIVKGRVVSITPAEVFVDLGFKSDGVIPADELSMNSHASPYDLVSVGDEIEVFVVRVNDAEGLVSLSCKKLALIEGVREVERAFESKTTLYGKVAQVVNGGIIVMCNGVRVFVPASLASAEYTKDLNVLLNREVPFRLIEMDVRRRKYVGSVKAVAGEVKQQKSEEFWNTAKLNQKIKGRVVSLTKFGAFVDLGGVTGLIYISELSWDKVTDPSDILKEGDEVEVYIKDLDYENKKVSLGYKDPALDPWNIAKSVLKVGDVVNCRAVRFAPFGIFAEIIHDRLCNIEGLVHISQISNKHVVKPASEISIGEQFEAKIVEFDADNRKVGLSRKVLLPDYVDEIVGAEEATQEEVVPEEVIGEVQV